MLVVAHRELIVSDESPGSRKFGRLLKPLVRLPAKRPEADPATV
jgi:hypothetical protein